MENRVRGQIFAGHILHDFALEIIVDDAGEEGQQRRRIGERKDQKIERNRQAAAVGRIIPRRRGKEVGKQRAQQRGHQAGNGKAADEAARTGQKAVVNHQLTAQPEEKREDQRKKAAVFQRARRMLFKRRAGGISRREQQQRGQYAIPKDQRIRAVGDEIRRGICGGQNGNQREQGGTALF